MPKMKKAAALLFALCLLCFQACAGSAEEDGFLIIRDGKLQPVVKWSDLREENYTNENSEILRFCVWVETDYDTDLDGMADLVKVLLQIPRAAAEGKTKAGVIYDPLPYSAGTVDRYDDQVDAYYTKEPFDSSRFYQPCARREKAGSMTTMEAAAQADPAQWNYITPDGNIGYTNAQQHDYFLVRGFAVAICSGIGTYGSEGFELCGTKLERDSHKAVVEWLAGNRRAFTDRTSNIEIAADWSNGNIAMTGASYGGTIPFEVAVTGVKGLRTIVPYCGIASWYDYTNSQGIPIRNNANYTEYLAASNSGGTFLDENWEVPNPEYGSWLWTTAMEEDESNGDYAPVWEQMDYTTDAENHIECSALLVYGLNDWNVTTRHADLMAETFQKAGKPVKLVLHQNGHETLNGISVNGRVWEDILNTWLSHYLYDVDNHAEELPDVLAQSNISGEFEAYDQWPGSGMLTLKSPSATGQTTVTSAGMANYTEDYQNLYQNNLIVDNQEDFYSRMPEELAAVYRFDLPGGTTIEGVPELRVKLDSDREDKDGLMISAVLMDVPDSGTMKGYFTESERGETVRTESIRDQEYDVGWYIKDIERLVQTEKPRKAVSYAWTDLQNPECGKNSAEYTYQPVGLVSGAEQDYTFYFQPVVYTVAEGHHLELFLMTWDPYRVYLDAWFKLDGSLDTYLDDATYTMTIDNDSLELVLPLGKGSVYDPENYGR